MVAGCEIPVQPASWFHWFHWCPVGEPLVSLPCELPILGHLGHLPTRGTSSVSLFSVPAMTVLGNGETTAGAQLASGEVVEI